jgi:hypothetical protein
MKNLGGLSDDINPKKNHSAKIDYLKITKHSGILFKN